MKNTSPILSTVFSARFILSFGLVAVVLGLLYYLGFDKNVIFASSFVFLCVSLLISQRGGNLHFAAGIVGALSVILLGFTLLYSYTSFSTIQEWDVLAFYFYAKAGADGLAIYDPASFSKIASELTLPFSLSQGFIDEVVKVGFVYPPTTMIFLKPLGWMSPESFTISWKVIVLLFLALDILLLYNLFKTHPLSWLNALIVICLTLMLPGTYTTIAVSQTNFILLFLLLLTFKNIENWKAGVFIALAVVIKPIAVLWGLYFLFSRNWKAIYSMAITGVGLIGISMLMVGFQNFLSFFTSPPASRIPKEIFSIAVNQSLNAVLIRANEQAGMLLSPGNLSTLGFGLIAVFLITASVATFKLIRKSETLLSFLVWVPMSLMVYPGCLKHYAVLLLPLYLSLVVTKKQSSILLLLILLAVLAFSSFAASLVLFTWIVLYAITGSPFLGNPWQAAGINPKSNFS